MSARSGTGETRWSDVDDGHPGVGGEALDLRLFEVRIITISTMREITRAVSSIGSARPSWDLRS